MNTQNHLELSWCMITRSVRSIIILMCWSAFLHSIQLNKNLAPTMDFAGPVKMATLELHLSPGQSPNSQQFVLRKAEKNRTDGPVHSPH